MMLRMTWTMVTGAVILLTVAAIARETTTVDYGRIASVNLVSQRNRGAQTRGTILGGALGAAAASNRGVGAVGGAIAGRQLGRASGRRQAFEYRIRFDGRSDVRVVTDEAGLRVGDCVAVERGNLNNLRLVDDDRCAPNTTPTQAAMQEADACIQAKEQLLASKTDEEFDRAERRVRLLCID